MKRLLLSMLFCLMAFGLCAKPHEKTSSTICCEKGGSGIEMKCKKGKVKIFDLYGRLCLKTRERKIDLSELPNGFYLVKNKQGAQVIQKIG